MTEPLLYAITTQELVSSPDMMDKIDRALSGGVQILQLRDKLSPDPVFYRKAQRIKELCEEYQVPFIVNDRLEIARELGVGLHLGDNDPPVDLARQLLGPQALIGRSCHGDVELAEKARAQGASYVAFGGVYPTITKPDNPVVGIKPMILARKVLDIPCVAIGGIDPSNVKQVVHAGPWAIAVARAVFASGDPKRAAEIMRQAISVAFEQMQQSSFSRGNQALDQA